MLHPDFVLAFREAAPYINNFRGKTFVIAVNGECIARGNLYGLAQDINLLVSLGVRIVLVHGARPQIDEQLRIRNLPRQFHHGRRVTDAATLEAVKAAVGGMRHDLEAFLSMGMPNSPMHGACLHVAGGNFVTAQPLGVIAGVDMQYSGRVRKIDTSAINKRLDQGELVLMSLIGYSPTGETFNMTMEEVACQAAIELKAEKLIFMMQSNGLVDADGVLHSAISAEQAESIQQRGIDSDEVNVSLPFAIRATREGVGRAHLVSHAADGALLVELFTDYGTGTMIARDSLVKVREATIDDVGDIMALIRPLEEQGILIKRSREHFEISIRQYFVVEHDERICGCVAMFSFPDEGMAELACLAVSQERRKGGFGDLLLGHVEKQAQLRGLKKLFILTTQTAHWFMERGFQPAEIADLPAARKELYNHNRRSKVFIKPLA
ncbi:amino-acid N-acetyltransferase [Vogesella sp. GCM10023246]|uniref:Amino-acid acetyltransferase n=1 Tax=Vogesella oryzagri TaxID=3160864 RepID=A0ABV1M9J1_9NEIS